MQLVIFENADGFAGAARTYDGDGLCRHHAGQTRPIHVLGMNARGLPIVLHTQPQFVGIGVVQAHEYSAKSTPDRHLRSILNSAVRDSEFEIKLCLWGWTQTGEIQQTLSAEC